MAETNRSHRLTVAVLKRDISHGRTQPNLLPGPLDLTDFSLSGISKRSFLALLGGVKCHGDSGALAVLSRQLDTNLCQSGD